MKKKEEIEGKKMLNQMKGIKRVWNLAIKGDHSSDVKQPRTKKDTLRTKFKYEDFVLRTERKYNIQWI